MDNKKRILLTSSLLMLPFTFGLFQLTTANFGPKWGYVSGFAGYWTYCLLTALLVSGVLSHPAIYFQRHVGWLDYVAIDLHRRYNTLRCYSQSEIESQVQVSKGVTRS